MITLHSLAVFVAIADAGKVAIGARKCGISASLASRRLAALEKTVGTRLMLRSTRSLRLTQAGHTFLEWSRETLGRFEQLSDELGVQKSVPAGLLRIACNDYIGHRFLQDVLHHFRQTYPGIRFAATISEDPQELIAQGYDLAVHSGSAPLSGLVGRRLISYRRIICASPAYVRQRGEPRKPADLREHDCLVHARTDTTRWFFRDPRRRIVSQPIAPSIEINSYPLLLDLAQRGLGIIRIAQILAKRALDSGDLVEVLEDFRCSNADGTDPAIWLTFPDRPRLSRVQLFADHLVALIKTIETPR